MNNNIVLYLLVVISFISCKNSKKKIDKLESAKQYYNILDNSDNSSISILLTDSILTIESNYEHTFSKQEYIEWLQWDSVFEPTYKIFQIEEENGIVKAKV